MGEIKKKEDEKYLIISLSGGHGKMVMSTAFIRAVKKKYPDRKIIVVAPWDGPYFYNPNIYRFYLHGEPKYFYDDYIKDKDVIIFNHEVYQHQDHLLQRRHLTEIWCDLFNVPYDGPMPEIILNPREIEIARDKIKPDNGKPIMLIQSNGGGSNQYSKKSWARDIPINIAQQVVDYFSNDYRILHVRTPEQPALNNVELLNLPFRELYAVFTFSKKRLFIDSFSQHVSAALNLPSTVCWITNKPKVFGYDIHDNILPNAKITHEFNKFSFLEKFDITGMVQQFNYDTVDLFDVNQIINSIKNQK
ncbi:MAG: glycosyltransferase family 9 protein [bacterium]